jgi:hypothetical protein
VLTCSLSCKASSGGGVSVLVQIVLNQTTVTYDSEVVFQNCTEFQSVFRQYASSWMPPNLITNQGTDALHINGIYSHYTRIVDLVINETGVKASGERCTEVPACAGFAPC